MAFCKTYSFEDGKYEIDRDTKTGALIDYRRNGEHWPIGFNSCQFDKSFHATLNHIDELEAKIADLNGAIANACI